MNTEPNPQSPTRLHSLDMAPDETVGVAWREFFRLCRHYAAIGRERERQANSVSEAVACGEETLNTKTA